MTDPTLPDTTLPDSTDSATPRPGVTDPGVGREGQIGVETQDGDTKHAPNLGVPRSLA